MTPLMASAELFLLISPVLFWALTTGLYNKHKYTIFLLHNHLVVWWERAIPSTHYTYLSVPSGTIFQIIWWIYRSIHCKYILIITNIILWNRIISTSIIFLVSSAFFHSACRVIFFSCSDYLCQTFSPWFLYL